MLPREYSLEDRTVIITAASRGIGKGIARVLAESGARVMVTALTDRYLRPLAEEMESAGHPIEAITADATKAEDWERTIGHALDLWGHIDVLINNLGDAIRKNLVPLPGSSGEAPITDEEWRLVTDVNLTQAFMGCRAIGKHMLERRKGKVINIAGFAARRGSPGMVAYAVAKAGVARLTQTLALEWAPYGITVNCIAPGIFPDPETAGAMQLAELAERSRTAVALGRVGELREVGLLAIYLASEASSYMTGETISLDGGLSYV